MSNEMNAKAESLNFQNHQYRAEIVRTQWGSPIVKIAATNPRGRYGKRRQIVAFIYEVAAELERRTDDLRERWHISPEPSNAQIVLETSDDDEAARAEELIKSLMRHFYLV